MITSLIAALVLTLTQDAERLLMAGPKATPRDLARRWKTLDEEIKTLSTQIAGLVQAAAPELLELHGVGTEIAAQFPSQPATTPTSPPSNRRTTA